MLRTTSTEQKYLFNGDNTESSNGAYDAAGAVFDYRRIDGLQDGEGVTEWITCTGPIREMLELMVSSIKDGCLFNISIKSNPFYFARSILEM